MLVLELRQDPSLKPQAYFVNAPPGLQEATYIPVMTSRVMRFEAHCSACKRPTQWPKEHLDVHMMTLSVDPAKGRHQSLEQMFQEDLQQHLPCPWEDCSAEVVKHTRFETWPLALMLTWNQNPVSPAAPCFAAHMI